MRNLGNTDLKIAPIVFGGNIFGWTIDEKKSFEILDAFVDAGFNAIDTADSYSAWVPGNSGGESEKIIGNWLQKSGKRESIIIATKVGWEISPERKGLKKQYILDSVENSLKNLKTDYIDLYQAHRDDQETPLEETLEAFELLKKQGKIRFAGASNYQASRLEEALRLSPQTFQTMQPEYNLYDRENFESELRDVCLKHNLGVITYFSLASGFLSGKYRNPDDASKSPRGAGIVSQYLNKKGYQLLTAMDEIARESSESMTTISLAWLLHQRGVTAPIVSATNLDQLNEVLRASEMKLTSEQLKSLDL